MPLLEDPPREDSEDFTFKEAQEATPTTDAADLVDRILRHVRGSESTIRSQELRRRGDHLYCRICLVGTHEPDQVLVYQIDWVRP